MCAEEATASSAHLSFQGRSATISRSSGGPLSWSASTRGCTRATSLYGKMLHPAHFSPQATSRRTQSGFEAEHGTPLPMCIVCFRFSFSAITGAYYPRPILETQEYYASQSQPSPSIHQEPPATEESPPLQLPDRPGGRLSDFMATTSPSPTASQASLAETSTAHLTMSIPSTDECEPEDLPDWDFQADLSDWDFQAGGETSSQSADPSSRQSWNPNESSTLGFRKDLVFEAAAAGTPLV